MKAIIFLDLTSKVRSKYNTGECFFTSQKLMFKLNMTFSASLKSLSIDREGFGTYTLVGDKLNE